MWQRGRCCDAGSVDVNTTKSWATTSPSSACFRASPLVSSWRAHGGNFCDLKSKVSSESAAIASLYGNVDSYPEHARIEPTGLLRIYTRQIIDISSPEMQRGVFLGGIPSSWDYKRRWWLSNQRPRGKRPSHPRSFCRFNQVIEYRRLRVDCGK